MWRYLRNKQVFGLKFFRQYGVGSYILDFYCPELRLAIEIDGGQHNDKINILRDDNRTKFLNTLDINVIRFWNNDLTKNIAGVLEKIVQEVNNFNPTQPPLASRGGDESPLAPRGEII